MIETVTPAVDGGRFPIKRIVGDRVTVEADIFADGHEALRCMLRYRKHGARTWDESEMHLINNDRWRGAFDVTALGRYQYTVTAWVDSFLSWRQDFAKREEETDIELALRSAGRLVEDAAARAKGNEARELRELARELTGGQGFAARRTLALAERLSDLMSRHPDRSLASVHAVEFEIVVDRPLARSSSWY